MINSLLYRLTASLPCRLIELDSGPYLERYYLGKLLGVTFYLHRFVSSDSEEHLHNHPWTTGAAIILSGAYTEEVAVDICLAAKGGVITQKKRRRWFNRVDGNKFHRIHAAAPGTWTLFFHGERARINLGGASVAKGWGFLDKQYLIGRHETVVFTPWPISASDWWTDAKTGAEIGRVELCAD